MNELLSPNVFIQQLASEVLDGVRPEHDQSPLAKFNFVNTVRTILDDAESFHSSLETGKITLVVPAMDQRDQVEVVTQGLYVYRRPIAFLNPLYWTDQRFFDPRLVHQDASKVFTSLRRTAEFFARRN